MATNKLNDKILITIPQGWADNHIERIAEKIMGGCIGILLPYDEQRFKLIQHRLESIIYNYIEESEYQILASPTLKEGESE